MEREVLHPGKNESPHSFMARTRRSVSSKLKERMNRTKHEKRHATHSSTLQLELVAGVRMDEQRGCSENFSSAGGGLPWSRAYWRSLYEGGVRSTVGGCEILEVAVTVLLEPKWQHQPTSDTDAGMTIMNVIAKLELRHNCLMVATRPTHLK